MVLVVDIDFDMAQNAWRANKIYIGNGSFRYITLPLKTDTKNKQTVTNTKCKYNLRLHSNSNIRSNHNHMYNLRSGNLDKIV